MRHGLQKPHQHGAARSRRPRFLLTFVCIFTVAAVALFPFSNAALSETEVVPTDDIILVRFDVPGYRFSPSLLPYIGGFQTLCLMNGAYPLAVYNTGTRDNVKAALIRDGETTTLLGGYSRFWTPSFPGSLVTPGAGTTSFAWVDEDNMIPRYAAGKVFFGEGADAPYRTWSTPPERGQRFASLGTTAADMVVADGSPYTGRTVACRKSSSSLSLDEDLASSIVFYGVVKFAELADYAAATFLQCAARDMRVMQPSTAMREFALEVALLRNASDVGELVLLGGGYDATSNAWRWHNEREEPRGAVFTTGRDYSDSLFAEQTYANWKDYNPIIPPSNGTNTLVLTMVEAWKNIQRLQTTLSYSVACEPLDTPLASKGLYPVRVLTSYGAIHTDSEKQCMLVDPPGEPAQIMSDAENDEMVRAMIRVAVDNTDMSVGTLPTAVRVRFMLGASRIATGAFAWDNFDLSSTPISYVPAPIAEDATEPVLIAAPTQLAWTTTTSFEFTHVMCQPSSVTPSKGNVTIVHYDIEAARTASVLNASNSSVSAADAEACGPDASPMIVRTAAEQKTLEAAVARAFFLQPNSPLLPRVNTPVLLNAVRRGGAWVWGDGTPVSFAMWDASAADPAGSEGDRLAVQLRERGWHAAAAPTAGTAYVACYAPAPDEEDNTSSTGDSGSSGWPWWAYLIIGVGAGVIVLLIILIVVLCCCGCCGACCTCGAAQDEEEKNTSEGTAGKSDAAAIPVGTQSAANLQRGSSRRSAPAADSAVAPKASRRASDLNRSSQTQLPHSQRAPQQQPAAAAPAANPYMAPPPYAFPPAVPPATGGYAPPAAAPTQPPSAVSPQTPAPHNSPQPLPPSRYEPYGVPASFWGSPKPNDSFYGPGASASPPPSAPPNNSPQAVQSPTEEEGAAPRRRLSRRGSVKFVPPSQNEYAQTPGDLQRVPSARARQTADDDVGMEL